MNLAVAVKFVNECVNKSAIAIAVLIFKKMMITLFRLPDNYAGVCEIFKFTACPLCISGWKLYSVGDVNV